MAKQIKNFLPTLIKADDSWQIQLLSNWEKIIGNLKTRITLEKIAADTLFIGVFDACWMQELYLLSPILLNTINQNLDQPRIKHLRFKRAVAKKQKQRAPDEQPKQVVSLPSLTTKEKTALATIKDPQLREALHQFLIRCHKEKV
ncbi:MAG TPA: DciA family protein [Candidatus Babeliales bacterium]|nr:DciA family protein [Candidatus Babeliales bacterium]